MRYRPEHKQATRDRIIGAAAQLFRTHGYEATGVDAIMAAVGLTPGGFYAHFASKESLLLETLSRGLAESATKIANAAIGSDDPFTGLVHRYLCALHRDDPGGGCPLPNLAADVSRLPRGARKGFTVALQAYLVSVEHFMPTSRAGKRRERALATLSTLVGAMALARAVSDPVLSEEIFASARHALLAPRKRRVSRASKLPPPTKRPRA